MVDKIKEDKIYGISAVESFYKKRGSDLIRLFVREGEQGRFAQLLSNCAKNKQLYRLVPNEELSIIAKTEHHEGICAIVKPMGSIGLDKLIDRYVKDFKSQPLIILDSVSNPHNIGAIIRSAVFFGFKYIIINSSTRVSLSGSLARMSEGGIEFASIAFSQSTERLIESLKNKGIKILISDLSAIENTIPGDLALNPFALILGSESIGVSKQFRENADCRFQLKGSGLIQSLNVSVFAGILFNEFYEYAKK